MSAATIDTKATYCGYIETTDDALLVFEACRLNMLQRRASRLCDSERRQISSGSVFVWDEGESGIKRWTDGKRWSPSRVNGCFLIYTELEPKSSDESTTNAEATLPASDAAAKSSGLIKKALSLFTTHNSKLHLVCYYRKEDVDQRALPTPSRDSLLCNIDIPRSLYPDILPEMVHVLSATTAAQQAQQQSFVDCRARRKLSVIQASSVITTCPVTQPQSADSSGVSDQCPSQSYNKQHTQLRIPAHVAVDCSSAESGNSDCRRRRDSLATVPVRLVSAPTSRRCLTITGSHDSEMLHRLDTASSKPMLRVSGGYFTPPATPWQDSGSTASDSYSRPPPPPPSAILPIHSRLLQQNTATSSRCQSHPSPWQNIGEANTLPAIGSREHYPLPAGPATAPSSRRNTIFNGDNASNSGAETSLPSISELLSSISTSPPLGQKPDGLAEPA
ncbi:Gluconate transport-inducing protein, partial [Coemansia sp. RSA 2052]